MENEKVEVGGESESMSREELVATLQQEHALRSILEMMDRPVEPNPDDGLPESNPHCW